MQNQTIMKMTAGMMDRDQRIRNIMKDYHSGNMELKQQSMASMLDEVDGFIRERVSKSSFYKHDFDDVVSACRCEVLSEMKNYDPEKGAPTTYFSFIILHAISQYSDTHYNKSTQPGTIATRANLTVKQVMDGLSIIRAANEKSISETEGTREYLAMYTKSTEEDYLKREEKNMWVRAMNEIDDNAAQAFMLFYGIESPPMSCAEIAKVVGIPQKDVKRIVEHTKRYLARNKEIMRYYRLGA